MPVVKGTIQVQSYDARFYPALAFSCLQLTDSVSFFGGLSAQQVHFVPAQSRIWRKGGKSLRGGGWNGEEEEGEGEDSDGRAIGDPVTWNHRHRAGEER